MPSITPHINLPDGKLKAMEIHDNSFGRSIRELLRELEAVKFVRENPGNVCPAEWSRERKR